MAPHPRFTIPPKAILRHTMCTAGRKAQPRTALASASPCMTSSPALAVSAIYFLFHFYQQQYLNYQRETKRNCRNWRESTEEGRRGGSKNKSKSFNKWTKSRSIWLVNTIRKLTISITFENKSTETANRFWKNRSISRSSYLKNCSTKSRLESSAAAALTATKPQTWSSPFNQGPLGRGIHFSFPSHVFPLTLKIKVIMNPPRLLSSAMSISAIFMTTYSPPNNQDTPWKMTMTFFWWISNFDDFWWKTKSKRILSRVNARHGHIQLLFMSCLKEFFFPLTHKLAAHLISRFLPLVKKSKNLLGNEEKIKLKQEKQS